MDVAGYLKGRWQRLDEPRRISGLDLARGLAVVGMLAAHLLDTAPTWALADPGTWDAVVNGRSSILFATLAGVSLGVFTGGASPHSGSQRGLDIWKIMIRAGTLYLLGLLLMALRVPVYVILPAYGLLFFLAVPALTLSARSLLLLSAGLGIVMPVLHAGVTALPVWDSPEGGLLSDALGLHYPFFVWISFVLAGMGLARLDVRRLPVQLWMLLGGGVLSVAGYGLSAIAVAGPLEDVWTAAPHSSGILEVFGSGGFAIAILGLCLLLCRARIPRLLTLPLRATGSMPLTAYTAQLVVWALVASAALGSASDLSGFRDLDPFWPFALGTMSGCTLWALLVGRGPLEAAVERVTRLVGR